MDRFSQLLVHPPLDPALNMAVDWWLLENADRPTIRFYRWDQPVISIGYRQQQSIPDTLHDLQASHAMIVRPTGGGFLYHHRDLSYSVVLPDSHPLTDRGILESYGTIREAFESGLESLKLLNSPEQPDREGRLTEDCLESPARHEPTRDGLKWMAASQLRHRGRLLQHGSLFWKDPDWPNDLHKPCHLHDPDRGVTLETVRRHLADSLLGTLLPESPPLAPTAFPLEWDSIDERIDEFRIDSLDQVPVFERFSSQPTT